MSNTSQKTPGAVQNFKRELFADESAEKREEDRKKQEETEQSKKRKIPVPSSERKPLQARQEQVDVKQNLHKTVVVTPTAPLSERGGFYCEKCNTLVKDSANWLDHINGKKHQYMIGNEIAAEKASLSAVQRRLQMLREKKSKKPSLHNETSYAVKPQLYDDNDDNNNDNDNKKNTDNSIIKNVKKHENHENHENRNKDLNETRNGGIKENDGEESDSDAESAGELEEVQDNDQNRYSKENEQKVDEAKVTSSDSNNNNEEKEEEPEEEEDEDLQAMAAMGLPTNFGSTKPTQQN